MKTRRLIQELANNSTQEPVMLMNQLKDWQSKQNNIAYNIPESESVNNDDIAAHELRKFQQSIAK